MPSQTNTTPARAGNVAIVVTSPHGPKVYREDNLRNGLLLLARFVNHQCIDGSESVWVFEHRKWVLL